MEVKLSKNVINLIVCLVVMLFATLVAQLSYNASNFFFCVPSVVFGLLAMAGVAGYATEVMGSEVKELSNKLESEEHRTKAWISKYQDSLTRFNFERESLDMYKKDFAALKESYDELLKKLPKQEVAAPAVTPAPIVVQPTGVVTS